LWVCATVATAHASEQPKTQEDLIGELALRDPEILRHSEPDLNAQHALDVYSFMSRGYHQFGIEWDARPVNLEPIREGDKAYYRRGTGQGTREKEC